MPEYNPMVDPDRQRWLALDEDERITAVLDYHEQADIDIPGEYAHALLQVIVENQVAMGEASRTGAVLARLIDEKLDRHDAIHAIGSILVNHLHELLHGSDAVVSNDDYYAALEKLTAEKWLRGEYSDG